MIWNEEQQAYNCQERDREAFEGRYAENTAYLRTVFV